MDALWTKPIEDPLSLMSFMVPPLRLLSAAMWQVTEQRQVKHYGMLEEFVTMVTESVPELLNYRQRAQLILGLRARLLLESCRVKNQVDMDNLQPQLDRIRGPRVNTTLSEVDKDIEESETHFLDLVQTIINNPVERENFFQNVFPVEYGPTFDKTIHTLMEDFLLQLDRMISVPDLSQTVSWLRACPSLLDKCLQSFSVPKQIKILLEHQRANGHLLENESLPLVRVVIPSDHTESGDPSELGNDLDGLEDDCHSSITPSDFHISGWSAKGKLKKETNELMEREDEEDDDDDDDNDDDEEYLPTKSDRGTLAHSRNQTSTKRTLGKSNKRKRDDKDVEVSREFTFINHLGAYTDEASYPTTEASKVPWTDEETFSLIDIWGKDSIQRTLKDCAHNRHIFNLISKMMSERGFARTAEQCHTRIKRLKMSFRQCHESNMRGKVRPEWKFYNLLEKIICGKDSFTNQEVRINAKDDTISDESTGQQEEEDTTDQEFLGHAGQEDTRSVSWTDLETQTLIKIWGEDRTQRELRGVHQNGHIFAMISKKMAAHSYIRTAEQCQTRMKRLKQCFKQCSENNLSMEGKEPVEYKFYKQMEKIMSNEESSHMLLPEVKDEESDSEYQVYTYQDIETAVNCTDDRKKVAWSDAETLILLQLWGDEQVQQNLQRCPHNGHIYSEISAKLNAHGYPRSAEQCQTRIKRLKISYRQCRDRISSSEAEHVDFKFYDLMEDIFQKNSSPKVPEVQDNESFSTIKSESQEACSSVEQTASGFWLDAETEALIDVWAEDEVQNALRGSVHNGHVFADIAEKLNSKGFLKTPEQCRLKIKNTRKNFRQCYEKKKCGIKEVGFKFYDKLEQLLGDEDFSTDDFDEKDDHDAESQWAGVVAVTESGRKMPWSHQETQALLEIWGEGRVQHSLKISLKNRHIYRYISKKMAALGFNRTGEQCHSRVKRLKAQFYYEGKKECKFYDQMEQILLKDTSTDKTSDEQDISELESITDSDSESAALSKPPSGEGPKLTWGDVETRVLISIWGSDKIQEKLKVSVIRRPIFEQIAQAMADKGFSRTAEQCRTRIKRLKASYRQCLESYRNNGEKVYWKFFNQIKKIFEKYPYLDEAETTVTQKPKTVGRETASTSANA